MAEDVLKVKITGDASELKGELDKAGGMVTGFSQKLGKIGRTATIAGAAVTAAFTKTFLDFTAYETKLVDMAKVTDEPFDQIEAKLGTMDIALGSSKELMEGYYQVISAGVKDPILALDTLTVAAQSAKAAHTEQSEVVKGITKMMAGYEGAIESAAEAADLLFSIEKEGQTNVAELIPVIGGLAKSSSDLNIGQEAMAASMAVISKTAGSTAEAATQYQAVLTGMLKPTNSMIEAIDKMGYKSAELAIEDLGLVEVLKKLKQHSEETGISMAKLFGRKEALLGFSALGAEGFKTLDETIVSVGEGVGGAQRAFEEWSETGSASIDEIKNTFLNFSKDIGEQLAPMIKDLLGKITEVIGKITEWAAANPKLFETIVKVAAVIGVAAAIGGPIMMAVAAFSGIGIAIAAIISPVGLVIAAIAGLAIAWKTNFLGIRDITKSVIDFIKKLFTGVVKFATESVGRLFKLIDGVKKFVGGLIDKIKSLGKGGPAVGAMDVKGSIAAATPGVVPGFHQTGISYVPKRAFYGLDPGERVLTKEENISYGGQKKEININIDKIIVGDNVDRDKFRDMAERVLEESARQYNRKGFETVPGIG